MLIEGRLHMVPVATRILANDVATVRRAALAGLGIAHIPSIAVHRQVESGSLVRVLKHASPDVGGIHVVYPHSRLLAPKVTEFVQLAVANTGRHIP
jgi:DNA-binding transcriptional LysR family regulator